MRRLAGSHVPNIKNRSSKHLSMIMGHKPAVRSMNNDKLKDMAENKCAEASRELTRRSNIKRNK